MDEKHKITNTLTKNKMKKKINMNKLITTVINLLILVHELVENDNNCIDGTFALLFCTLASPT